MELIILIGIPAAGKSTFYVQNFFHTHVRINLDQLKTRQREQVLLHACLATGQPVVIDNTNVSRETRSSYISAAKAAGFKVSGYFFDIPVRDAIGRNKGRRGKAAVAVPGILGKYKKLEPPAAEEGFDRLFTVTINESNEFVIREQPEQSSGQL